MKEFYFVNACRGLLDFQFLELEEFSDLEYAVMVLSAMGYEINSVTLVVEK